MRAVLHGYWLEHTFARSAARELLRALARCGDTYTDLLTTLEAPHMRACAAACLDALLQDIVIDDRSLRVILAGWLIDRHPVRAMAHGHDPALARAAHALIVRLLVGVAQLAASNYASAHTLRRLPVRVAAYLAAYRAWRVVDTPRRIAAVHARLACPCDPHTLIALLEQLAILEAARAALAIP